MAFRSGGERSHSILLHLQITESTEHLSAKAANSCCEALQTSRRRAEADLSRYVDLICLVKEADLMTIWEVEDSSTT